MRFNPFAKPTPAEIRQEHLDDAQRMLLGHAAAAEHHAALARMYADRISRLEAAPQQGDLL